jgi:excisionase family DNA binding protein
MSNPELLTVAQLAERLQIRPRTVQAWARKRRIPAVRLSAKVIRFYWRQVLLAIQKRAERRKDTP